MQGLQPGDRLVVTVDGGRSITFDDCGTAGEGCATDRVSGWAAQGGAGFGTAASRPAGEQRFCRFFSRFEVGLEEFFPFFFGYGTVDGVFQMFFLVGHSDFPFIVQIWLRGPAESIRALPGGWHGRRLSVARVEC